MITAAFGSVVGFEVDHIDDATSEGWSVLATGRVKGADATERAELTRLGLEPWAGGYRDIYVLIQVDTITGRRDTSTSLRDLNFPRGTSTSLEGPHLP